MLKEPKSISIDWALFVPKVGIEPTLQRNTSLSRARLPVPPLRQIEWADKFMRFFSYKKAFLSIALHFLQNSHLKLLLSQPQKRG